MSSRARRRSFSAPYANPKLGWTLISIGAVLVVGLWTIPVSAGLITWGIYLLRGKGTNPAVVAQRAQERLAAEGEYKRAFHALALEESPARRLVLARRMDQHAQAAFGTAARKIMDEALAVLSIPVSSLNSTLVGVLYHPAGGPALELYRDWVIRGDEAYDVDEYTRVTVHLDGAVQVVPRQIVRGDKVLTVNEEHDMRRAEVHIVSRSWSMAASINPDRVNDARLFANQLGAHLEALRPAAATSADIESMVEAILRNTGQPPAEKLKQLSNLRFDRLLSDDEFRRAKERILGIEAN